MEQKQLALVTGASRGIGAAIAGVLASKGFGLILVARDLSALGEVASSIRSKYRVEVHVLVEDLADPMSPRRILQWCEDRQLPVSMLVNNAGFGLNGLLEEYDLQRYEDMVTVNNTALMALTYLFLPQFRQRERAWILNIASTAAYQAVPSLAVYAATKAFVLYFSRAIHHELKGTPVSVTCVSPGPTDTAWASRAQIRGKAMKAAEKMNMSPEAVAEIAVKATLAGRAEVVAGFMNKMSAFFAKVLPAGIVERVAHGLYK
jgi:short-subunit dehydrogenase